jgi:hypothetical protein
VGPIRVKTFYPMEIPKPAKPFHESGGSMTVMVPTGKGGISRFDVFPYLPGCFLIEVQFTGNF